MSRLITIHGSQGRKKRRGAALNFDADADWSARSTSPGVVIAHAFNSIEEFGNFGENGVAPFFYEAPGGVTERAPTFDTTYRCSGAGSIRFHHPSNWNANVGAFIAYFGATRGDGQLGEPGQSGAAYNELWLQFRCRWSSGMEEVCAQSGGVKWGGPWEAGPYAAEGSNLIGITMQSQQTTLMPIMYTFAMKDAAGNVHGSPQGYDVYWPASGAVEKTHNTQNVYPSEGSPTCFSDNYTTPGNCWWMPLDTWVTFMSRLKILGRKAEAPWNGLYWDIELDLWAQVAGQSPQQLMRWAPDVRNYMPQFSEEAAYNAMFGKTRFLPYTSYLVSGEWPTSTISSSNITGDHTAFNEAIVGERPSSVDDTFAYGANNVNSEIVVGFPDPTHGSPNYTARFSSRYRYFKTNDGVASNDGGTVTIRAEIYEGATLKFTDTEQTCTGTAQERTFVCNLSGGVISDWTNLRMRLVITAAGTGRSAGISHVVLGGARPESYINYDELIVSSVQPAWPAALPIA